MTELLNGYHALLGGRTPDWQPLQTSFREYVALEKEALDSQEAKAFWLRQLEDVSPLVLPESAQTDPTSVPRWGKRLSAELTENLRRLALAASVPLKSVVLAAHIRALALATGLDDMLTGLIGNARPEALDGEKIVGLFLNTLPLRARLRGGTWIDLAKQVFEMEQAMMAHRRYPLAQIQNDLGVDKLLHTAFNYVHFHVFEDLDEDEEKSEILGTSGFDQTHFTLLVNAKLDTADERLLIGLNGNPMTIDEATIFRIGNLYIRVLETMASDPQGRYDAATLTDASTLRRLKQINRTETSLEAAQPIHTLFPKTGNRFPQSNRAHRGRDQRFGRRVTAACLCLSFRLAPIGSRPRHTRWPALASRDRCNYRHAWHHGSRWRFLCRSNPSIPGRDWRASCAMCNRQ